VPEHTQLGTQKPFVQQPDLQSEATSHASEQPQLSPPQVATVERCGGSQVTAAEPPEPPAPPPDWHVPSVRQIVPEGHALSG
jgi:hypothetical protein